MFKEFYAIDLALFKVTADVNDFDVVIGSTIRERVRAHYDGHFPKDTADALYERLTRMIAEAHPRKEP